jgi:hypothetical protein
LKKKGTPHNAARPNLQPAYTELSILGRSLYIILMAGKLLPHRVIMPKTIAFHTKAVFSSSVLAAISLGGATFLFLVSNDDFVADVLEATELAEREVSKLDARLTIRRGALVDELGDMPTFLLKEAIECKPKAAHRDMHSARSTI